MISDALVAYRLFNLGLILWGTATTSCILLSLVIQVFFTFLQHHNKSARYRWTMMAWAFSGFMPVYQSFHVWLGKEQELQDLISPQVMLSLLKGAEIVFRSLPNAIFQTITLLTLETSLISNTQIFSLVISFCSGALVCTLVSFDIERSVMVRSRRGRRSKRKK